MAVSARSQMHVIILLLKRQLRNGLFLNTIKSNCFGNGCSFTILKGVRIVGETEIVRPSARCSSADGLPVCMTNDNDRQLSTIFTFLERVSFLNRWVCREPLPAVSGRVFGVVVCQFTGVSRVCVLFECSWTRVVVCRKLRWKRLWNNSERERESGRLEAKLCEWTSDGARYVQMRAAFVENWLKRLTKSTA